MKTFNNCLGKLIIIISLMVIISCQKEMATKDGFVVNCVFVQNDTDMDGEINNTERSLMDECSSNLLASKSEIEKNIIGSWELEGYGNGWRHDVSQPCGLILITESELTFAFENANVNINSIHQWEIEKVGATTGSNKFRLIISPESVEGLNISHFCNNYMYGDATPRDGDMYLYKKME